MEYKKHFYYKSKSKFNNNPVQVIILKETKRMALVETKGSMAKTTFWARKSSIAKY